MKKAIYPIAIIVLSIGLSSCGVGAAYVYNHNANTTQVQLGSNNYKVVEWVTGSAEVDYVLIFGGLNKRQLYANAYSDLVNKAQLKDGSKALVNLVTEEHVGGFPPFYTKRTLTVSANVVEFSSN